jgi:hypothetical protein
MTYTTIQNNETKLADGTYRLTKSGITSPALVRNGMVLFLTKGVILDGKTQYKKF